MVYLMVWYVLKHQVGIIYLTQNTRRAKQCVATPAVISIFLALYLIDNHSLNSREN